MKKLDSQQTKIIKELSERYNLTKKEILEIVESPFKFIRKEIKELEFQGDETQEEFETKIKNFNIPSLGKLYGNYYNFKRIQDANNKKRRSNE